MLSSLQSTGRQGIWKFKLMKLAIKLAELLGKWLGLNDCQRGRRQTCATCLEAEIYFWFVCGWVCVWATAWCLIIIHFLLHFNFQLIDLIRICQQCFHCLSICLFYSLWLFFHFFPPLFFPPKSKIIFGINITLGQWLWWCIGEWFQKSILSNISTYLHLLKNVCPSVGSRHGAFGRQCKTPKLPGLSFAKW